MSLPITIQQVLIRRLAPEMNNVAAPRRIDMATLLFVGTFVVVPELRRLSDWAGGPSAVSLALPLLPLIVSFALALRLFRAKIEAINWVTIYLLSGASFIALVYGLLAGRSLSALYTFMDLVFPLAGAAGLLYNRRKNASTSFAAVLSACLAVCGVCSIYAVIQWFILPPWDAQWLSSGVVGSAGYAKPMAFRAFGTLNGPGVFAAFAALVAVTSVSQISAKRPWTIIFYAITIIALLLSFVRAAWIAAVGGILLYALLSRKPAGTIGAMLGAIFAFVLIGTVVDTQITGGMIINAVAERATTITDISNDLSANDRSEQISAALLHASVNPLGDGLGEFGGASQLDSTSSDIAFLDSGYLARIVEMGWIGSAGFFVAYALALFAAARNYMRNRAAKTLGGQDACAAAIACLCASLLMMFSGDTLRGVALLTVACALYASLASYGSGSEDLEVAE